MMRHWSPPYWGVLKAGSIVVALDPGDPVSRLKMLVEDAEPGVIVTDVQNRNLAAEFGHPGCRILNFESETATGPVQNPSIEIPPEQTAFLTYTSGTTGRPKGVMKPIGSFEGLLPLTARLCSTRRMIAFHYLPSVSTGQGSEHDLVVLLNGAMLCPFRLKTRGDQRIGRLDH